MINQISKIGESLFTKKINNIYSKLLDIKNKFNEIKNKSDNSNSKDFKDIVDKYIFKDLSEIEKEKDNLINTLLTKNN